jgi:hypothetical protein
MARTGPGESGAMKRSIASQLIAGVNRGAESYQRAHSLGFVRPHRHMKWRQATDITLVDVSARADQKFYKPRVTLYTCNEKWCQATGFTLVDVSACADFDQRVCRPLAHTAVAILECGDERRDGAGVANLPQPACRPHAHTEILLVPQRVDQALDIPLGLHLLNVGWAEE